MWTGDKPVPDNWKDSWTDTENMFKEAGVQYNLLMP
jgi:hypothetical protein